MDNGFAKLTDDLKTTFRGSMAGPWPDERFGEWALRVFQYQFEANPTYSRYCRNRGLDPSVLERWEEIPPVPTSAFKVVPLVSGDPSRVQRVFRTSGTTRGAGSRGAHYVLDLDLYRASLTPNIEAHLYPPGPVPRLLALVPSPDEVPDSSLSFMLAEALSVLSDGDGGFFVRPSEGLDVVGLSRALATATEEGVPVLLAGTAFAFVHWLGYLAETASRYELPAGSRILETGGFKGRSRALSRPEFYQALSSAHAVPIERIVNEYGMTELLSQRYEPLLSEPQSGSSAGSLEHRRHVAPPWMRTRVLDPVSLEPVPVGREGLLCHYDLANAGSVMAVLTEDLGSVDDEGRLRFAGRLEGAEPRGCSLAMDQLLSTAGEL